ncbi:MAG: DUF192 domain-containing protein [Rhodothermaceae bacterium]|nr:DUF192 domain-containing protein [Rhodothermaceae bacterium]MXZ18875.1 DUF192 domain-containing protein [Rhodothermaceae bacterium]MXZ58216.1 DUF192 domain-containing protein [Rhodothermaceae bacterium]MYB92010.1 DUF192 domain-containing protein [Rhodothermaceae bacterium]MYD66766.1 DUF192 domain-containing protein [Rhodothermaceae bacterium]
MRRPDNRIMAWLNQPYRIRLKHRTATCYARMRHILIAVIAVIALQGCSEEPVEPAVGELDFVGSNGEIIRTIEIEFAEDDESRETGLMHRRQLSLSQGMLFIFPTPDSLSFWMANTPIPLDIIFIGADSAIVNIAKRTTPLSREFIRSTDLAQYVVEVRGGFSDRFGIDTSTRIQWRKTENTE